MAITLVLMRHFFDLYLKGYEGLLAPLFSWGWHGVDLFFALSGFLIGGQMIEEFRAGEFSFRRFFVKRSFRILPPYFAAIAVFVVVFSFTNGFLILRNADVLNDFLAHAFYLQDYVQSGQMMYNGIYWSLAVEEKFYIGLPLVIFFLYQGDRSGKSLFMVLGALALSGVALRFLSYEQGADFWSEYLAPFHLRFDSLLLGVLAAFLFIKFRGRLSSAWKWALAAAVVSCLAMSFLCGSYGTGYFNVCWQFTLTGVGFSALILLLVSVDAGKYLPFRKAFSAVARYSYAMYLYHILILTLAHQWLKELIEGAGGGTAGGLIAFAAYFGAVTAASAVVYYIVDRPFMNWRRRVLGEEGKKEAAADGKAQASL